MAGETEDAPVRIGVAPQEQPKKNPFELFLKPEGANEDHEGLKQSIVQSWKGLPDDSKKGLLEGLRQIAGPFLHYDGKIGNQTITQRAEIPTVNGQNLDEAFAGFLLHCHIMRGHAAAVSESIPGLKDTSPLELVESLVALAANNQTRQPNSSASL
ncbi:MAG TPA: hypothetical protein VMW29_01940 [Candidatus Bathyarchaeia archaeon]|nr:hypothetical protein [Candidatus Bathyarchaeia archaeon]